MKKLLLTLLIIFTFGAGNVFAMGLGDAKNQGLVGETPTGYLGAVVSPSGDVNALINDINGKRKNKYSSIAEANGTSLEAVEHMAGETAMKKTKKGHYIQVNGNWIQK